MSLGIVTSKGSNVNSDVLISRAQAGGSWSSTLSDKAARILRAARLWITLNRPYYSAALFAAPLIAANRQPTMAIDEQWRIYVNSEFVESCSVERAAAVLIHELNHALRAHADRARTLGVGLHERHTWNAAGDCEINDDLVDDGLDIGSDCLMPSKLGLVPNRTAEQYFRELSQGGSVVEVASRCGLGCTGQRADHEIDSQRAGYGLGTQDHDGLDEVRRESLRTMTAQAVAEHHLQNGCGSVPSGLRRWANQILQPKANWQSILASAVRRGVHLRAGSADYSWQRPARRDHANSPVIHPGMTKPIPDIAVVVDTSGSMRKDDLSQALAEIHAILTRVVAGEAIRLYSVDTEVATNDRVFSTNRVTFKGGGGTDMRVGIAAAAATKPAAIIVISDGYTPWPDTRPRHAPMVIAAITRADGLRQVPKWMQAIDISNPSHI